MKKYLIGFIIMIISIIPLSNVSALIGSDNNEYPSKPNDEYNNYFIYYTDTNCSDCGTPRYKGYYLVSYSDIGTYVASSYMNSSNYSTEINVFKSPPFRTIISGESPGLGSPNNDVPFKRYRLINNEWKNDLSRNTDLRLSSVYKIIYSTKDIYYRTDSTQSTYPSGNGFIPGTYKVTIDGLEGAYQFKTYNADYTESELNPTFEIGVSYTTDFETNLSNGEITFNYKNLDSIYQYQYSFNNNNWTDISFLDIVDNKYKFKTYQNGKIYGRILDINKNVVFEDSSLINMVVDTDDIYYYELNVSDLYDLETNRLKYKYFFYENKSEPVYFGFKILGDTTKELPISLIRNGSIIDKNLYINNLSHSFDNIYRTPIPYEYIKKNNFQGSYKSYSSFVIVPCIDLETEDFSSYTSEKIVIKSNLKIDFSNSIVIDGVLRPSTDDINNDVSTINTFIMNILNPILKKIPIIDQLSVIYKTFNYDYDNTDIPVFTVNLSFLGINKDISIIDFSFFLQYRDIIFSFEKLFLSFFTLSSIVKIIRKSLNGGG